MEHVWGCKTPFLPLEELIKANSRLYQGVIFINPYAVLAFAYPSCRFLSMCTHRPFIIIFSRLSLATVTKVASNYRTRFSLSNGGFFFSLACLDRLVIYR